MEHFSFYLFKENITVNLFHLQEKIALIGFVGASAHDLSLVDEAGGFVPELLKMQPYQSLIISN